MLETTKTTSYASLREFVVANRLMLPKPTETWRLVKDQPIGSISGIPTIIGKAVATNGIIVAVQRTNGEVLWCHLQWFEPERNEGEIKQLKAKVSAEPRSTKFSRSLMDFGK